MRCSTCCQKRTGKKDKDLKTTDDILRVYPRLNKCISCQAAEGCSGRRRQTKSMPSF